MALPYGTPLISFPSFFSKRFLLSMERKNLWRSSSPKRLRWDYRGSGPRSRQATYHFFYRWLRISEKLGRWQDWRTLFWAWIYFYPSLRSACQEHDGHDEVLEILPRHVVGLNYQQNEEHKHKSAETFSQTIQNQRPERYLFVVN